MLQSSVLNMVKYIYTYKTIIILYIIDNAKNYYHQLIVAYLLPSYSDIDLGKPCLSAASHDLKQWWCIVSKVQ